MDATLSFPIGMASIEYPIIEAGAENTGDLLLGNKVFPLKLDNRETWRAEEPAGEEIYVNSTLEGYGYHLSLDEQKSGHDQSFYILFKGQEQVLDAIDSFSQVTVSSSREDFVMTISVLNGSSWLLRKDGLSPWARDPMTHVLSGPIYYGEDLIYPIWNPNGSQVQVIRNGEPIFSVEAPFIDNPVSLFTQWQGHWLLEVDGFLVQDGVILNQALGYEEIFNWRLLDGKPFYFFRKGPRVGISYDGKILPVSYDDVFHGGCCGYGRLNPIGSRYMAGYYALQEEMWYYVELGFK